MKIARITGDLAKATGIPDGTEMPLDYILDSLRVTLDAYSETIRASRQNQEFYEPYDPGDTE
jgi:hypothetical protein